MKRNLLFILVALLPLVTSADGSLLDAHFIYVTGTNGWAGSSAELTLNMYNYYPVSSWKCDLILPEGVTFKSITPIKDRFPEGYEAEFTTNVKDDGSVTIICNGTEDIGLNGTDGAVATVKVDIADMVTSGKYMVTLQKIYLIECNGNIHYKDYTEFKWIVMGGSAPFVEEGKVWQYNSAGVRPNGDIWTWDETYSLEGDTAIGSFLCQKLYYSCTEPYPCNHRYKGALYQSGRKVFYIAPNSTTSTLLYDFCCVPGDTLKVNGGKNEYFITEKRLVNYRAKYLTVTEWDQRDLDNHFWRDEGLPPDFYDDMSWIEGIGSRRDLLNEFNEWYIGGGTPHLERCTLNGEVLYDYYDFKKNAIVVTGEEETTRKYYPEGTKWTEIRLDTLKYDSWYSKVGDEWVPNFETVEYSVKYDIIGKWYSMENYISASVVYTSGPEWSDSLAICINENHTESDTYITAIIDVHNDEYEWMEYTGVGEVYQFNWAIGKELYYQDMFVSGTVYPDMTSEGQEYPETMGYNRDPWVGESHSYGTIKEIKEGYFGGVRPLKYVDLDGIRIIHGIGVTEWKEGECIFGPLKPYNTSYYFRGTPPERHYRSMLVHFERDGEVLYDVWPEKETATAVTYTKGQMATIILPTAPDAGKGKYYRLDKCEDGKIIFEQEKQPQDHIPYIIVPSEDFSIDTSTLDLAGLSPDTVSIAGISFIGSYSREKLNEQEGWYIDIIDTTPDCGFASSGETGKGAFIGALRAYLTVNWDDPINHNGSKGPGDKLEIVLKDNPNSLNPTLSKGEGDEIVNGKWSNGKWFDLQGRKLSGRPARGIYIEDGKKKVMK